MDEHYKIIDQYNALLYEIYKQQDIKCLTDDEYRYQGKPVLAMCNEAVVQSVKTGLYAKLKQICEDLNIPLSNKNFTYNENELCNITGDIKYRIGTLYLYHPFIVRLIDNWGYHKGKKHFVYNQTREDSRFNREIPVAFENIYKFWQRISNYLSCFFPEVILKLAGKTYFHHPFEHILSNHPKLKSSDNFQWLSKFAQEEYPKFNSRRKFFVHSSGYDNEFFRKFLDEVNRDEKAVSSLDAERDGILVYLKEQLNYCLKGYVCLMEFLNELDFEPSENGEFIYAIKENTQTV